MATGVKQEELSKRFALINEVETSVKLIKLGLGEIQNLNTSNGFYFLPLQLLSQGLERFMKSYLCLAQFGKTGAFPGPKYLRTLGHSLEKLTDEVLSAHFAVDPRPQIIEDEQFLRSDQRMRELLSILSDFGRYTRYHNLNIVTGEPSPSIDPAGRWTVLETDIRNSDPALQQKLFDWEQQDSLHMGVARHVVILFERFVSALSRQMLFGFQGELAKQYSSIPFDFALIYEKERGIRDYRHLTTRYLQTPKRAHKRTAADDLQLRLNPSYKWRAIRRDQFDGEWPFYEDEVVVECRDRKWCVIAIDGYDYALNGRTSGHLKLDNPHEGGRAVLGKSLDAFTKLALELCKA